MTAGSGGGHGPAVALVVAVVGLAFAALGAFRPAAIWATPKLAAGRAVIGETPMRALCVTLGLLLLGLAPVVWARLRR